MEIKQAADLIKDNLIVKHFAGSIAYGTNIATSDVDYRGIFVANPVNIRTPFFRIDECKDTTEEDTTIYELNQFMKLALDCNPNIVESLFVAPEDIVFSTPAYEHLHSFAPQLLSSKIAFTTSGYALAQLKRIKGHHKWINNAQPEKAPMQCKYISLVHNFTEDKVFHIDLKDYHTDYRLVPFAADTYGIYPIKGYETYNIDSGNLNTTYEGDTHKLGTPLFIIKFNKNEYNHDNDMWSNYWTWKKNRNVVRSALEEQSGYDCYSEDTEFLTNSGWKLFDDVTHFDLIATFNQETHKIEYQLPMERIDSIFTGNMYQLSGQHTNTNVSPNHWMYIRKHSRTTNITNDNWELVQVAELPETFDTLNMINPKTNRNKLPIDFNVDILEELSMLSFMRLMGWYISDGTLRFSSSDTPSSMIISQSKPQSRLTQNLTRQINLGHIKCTSETIYEKSEVANYPERRWNFSAKIAKWLYFDCGHKSENKRIPNWVFSLTKREMTTLLVALLQGDGTKKDHQNHTYVYYTKNNLLADDVQRLSFLCGFETSKWGPYNNSTEFNPDLQMYQVHINMRPKQFRRHVRSASIEITPVNNQRIVCFMVKNHTLVTRRNGNIGLHGNTKHAMHLVRLLRMGAEALETGILNVKRPDAAELLEIRNGAWTYDELVKYAESMDKHVCEVLYKKTSLPRNPNIKLAAQLIMDIQDMVW